MARGSRPETGPEGAAEPSGQDAAGDWALTVSDRAAIDVGSLDDWTLHAIGVPN